MSHFINCEDALERLFEYLDGELSRHDTDELRRHMEVCEACYPDMKFTTEFRDALHRAAQGQPVCPESLRSRVRAIMGDTGS
jgi:anti-sigma factor (TIGR02949 family)